LHRRAPVIVEPTDATAWPSEGVVYQEAGAVAPFERSVPPLILKELQRERK